MKTCDVDPSPPPAKSLESSFDACKDSEMSGPIAEVSALPVASWECRSCVLCKKRGDLDPCLEGRLLHHLGDTWIHVGCAVWSSEVVEHYEDGDGGLANVTAAVTRGCRNMCSYCGESGATLNCCHRKCRESFHLSCAMEAKVLLGYSYKHNFRVVYCAGHSEKASMTQIKRFNVQVAMEDVSG